MRDLVALLFACVLVAGCDVPAHPAKPSPYHYAHLAPTLMVGAYEKELI